MRIYIYIYIYFYIFPMQVMVAVTFFFFPFDPSLRDPNTNGNTICVIKPIRSLSQCNKP